MLGEMGQGGDGECDKRWAEWCWMNLVGEVHMHVDGGEEGVLSGMRMYPTNYYQAFRENGIEDVLRGRDGEEGGGGEDIVT